MISPATKIKLALLVFSAIFIIFLIFVIIPFFRDIHKISQDLALQQGTLRLLDKQIANLNHFQKNYESKQPILQNLENNFVDFEAPISFIEFLEEASRKENLIMAIRPLSALTTKVGLWQTVGFQIMVGGSFSDCLRFLERLEYGPWLFDVNQLYIERIQEKSQKAQEFSRLAVGDVIFSFNVKAFSGVILNPSSSDIKSTN